MATIVEARGEEPLGWLGASLGAAHSVEFGVQLEITHIVRATRPPVRGRKVLIAQSSIMTPVAVKANRSSGSVMAAISSADFPASSA